MNRAFLIVGIPAVLTSFGWLAFGWGWRLAATVTTIEIALIVAFVVYVLRLEREKTRSITSGETTAARTAAEVETGQAKPAQ